MKIDFTKKINLDLVNVPDNSSIHSFSFYFPDVEFIKLNFKDIKLPNGAYVEFSDEKRKYVHFAAFSNEKKYTLIINSNTANIKIVLPIKPTATKKYSMKLVSIEGQTLDTLQIIGEDQRKPFMCFSGTDIGAHSLSATAVKLGGWGSGSLIGSGNFILSNRHVVLEEANLANGEIWLNWFNESCDPQSPVKEPARFAADRLLAIGGDDYALFNLKDFDYRNAHVKKLFGGLKLNASNPVVGNAIYIPQYGNGGLRPMYVSERKGNDYSRVLSVGTNVEYNADTQSGSSGSPVIAQYTNGIAALHFAAAGSVNIGLPVATLHARIGSIIGANNISVIGEGKVTSFNLDVNPVQKASITIDFGVDRRLVPFDTVTISDFSTYSTAEVECQNLFSDIIIKRKFKVEALLPSGPTYLSDPRLNGIVRLNITPLSSGSSVPGNNLYKSWLPLKLEKTGEVFANYLSRIIHLNYDPFEVPFDESSALKIDYSINSNVNSSMSQSISGAQFGYIALYDGQGPQALVWTDTGYSVVRTVLRNSSGEQVIIHLRGQRATGCSTRPMNAAVACADGINGSRLILSYHVEDNVGVNFGVGLSGIIPLQAQEWDNYTNYRNILVRITCN
ncbi:trypsin-like serine peptidase [Yersinia sp. 2538 StPb PI]|uniref:trypsin-like serine peptidase n=1 Tax=Yersinia sp. 2538 StPb PI TaxID=3117405 RepID=UPI003FA4804F